MRIIIFKFVAVRQLLNSIEEGLLSRHVFEDTFCLQQEVRFSLSIVHIVISEAVAFNLSSLLMPASSTTSNSE